MKHVPNILSGARVLAAPYVCFLLWQRDFVAALIWMAVLGASDGVDGYLARRFEAQSKLGAMLDPIGDKVLLDGAFVALGLNDSIPSWIMWLVVGRDLAIVAFALIVLAVGGFVRDFPPTYAGKVSTTFQIVFVLLVAAHGAGILTAVLWGILEPLAGVFGAWLVAIVTAWSGVNYAYLALSRQR
jgi:cardiolipin synthase (CMP-forming)